jgi:hypothetical protein
MYKKSLISCLLFLVIFISRGQVSMTLQVPPTGVLVKPQLWNMVLVNTGGSILARVNLVLVDEKTNQALLTASSIPFLLGKGAHQLQAKDLSPIQYNYNSPAFHASQGPNGLLPVGAYQACYTLVNAEKAAAPLVESCVQLNIDPLSPPLLNTPADESELYTSYPQFTWLPPMPPGMFDNLSYDLILVEVLPGQGKGDAIQQNIPVWSGGFIKDLFLNYPSSYRALDTGRLYAWRIVALNDDQPVAMTDIWSFHITTPQKPTIKQQPGAFVDLRRGLGTSVASSGETLKLTYENLAADTAVNYTITGLQDASNPIVQKGQLSLIKGRNFLQVPLLKSGGFAERKVYLFQFINSRNETWTMKFTWSPSSADNSLN